MKSRFTAFAVLTMLALAVSACSAKQGVPNTGGYGYGGTVAATEMPKTGASVAQVIVKSNPKFGSILTDAQGRTLYLLTKDGPNAPTCYNDCAKIWPPLLANGASTAGTGLDASKLGTVMRTDGGTQVAYNGHPLYYYAPDKNPGDTNGEGIGGVWFVVSPSGEPIKS